MANVVNISQTNTFEEWRVKNNEIGDVIGDLSLINSNTMAGEDTIIPAVNNLRTETTNNAGWIGDISLLFNGYSNLVEALNNAHGDISTIAAVANIDIDSASVANYDGTETSWIDILNTDYARLNDHDTEIGTIGDLYDTTNYPSLVTASNNLNSRLSDIETDVGDWSTYDGIVGDPTIVSALNSVKARQDLLSGDFLNVGGDTMTGDLNFNAGGIQATSQYLNIGVNGTNTIRINTSNRIGVGKAAHSSYKFDVEGTLNATDIKIGGESLDDRFLEVNTVSGWDEIDANVEFKSDVTVSDKITLGSTVIYDAAGDSFDEVVQDLAGNMFEGNTESGGISAVYSDATGKITLGISDDGHNHVVDNIDGFTENVQDIVGAMVGLAALSGGGNSESGIQVLYQDADGTLDFNVNDPVITLDGDVTGHATMSNLGDVTITTTVGNDNHNHDGRYYTESEANGKFLLNTTDTLVGTLTVTGNTSDVVHASSDYMQVGSNGSGDSFIDFYDDNSNTWRTFKWDDLSNEWQMEDDDGTLRRVMHSGNTLKVLNSGGTQLFP